MATKAPLPQVEPIPHNWEFEPRLVTDFLDHAVLEHAERPAVDFLGRTWAYKDIGILVERTARGLQDLGLAKGDRFALCLPNTPYFIVLYFAALKLGAVIVNMNPLYTEREMEHILRDSGARMVAVPDIASIHEKLRNVGPGAGVEKIIMCPMAAILPAMKSLGWRVLKIREHAHFTEDGLHVAYNRLVERREPHDPVEVLPDDLAVLQYTGGTTGIPKGAMLTHANLTANALQQRAHIGQGLKGPQRTLAVLPMFHVFALTAVLNFSVEIAAELVLLPRFEMGQFLETIKRKPPSLFFGVPTLFIALNALPEEQRPDFSGLRACISGGAPLPLDVRQTFEELMGAHVCEGYGLTEASPIVACNMVDGLVKENSCGRRFPGTLIEIRDMEDPSRVLPVGEKGEICVRGPQVMAGYWKKPEETEKVFVDGALRTGDIGYLDEDGYLFLIDRMKDMILCGGYNVYPRVIEEAAYQHPAIEEAIAIGVPDPYRGQAPKLFVKLHEGQTITPPEIRSFLEGWLNRIELPREVEIREKLPKTMVGKLSKKELVEEERLKREKPG
ncbi:long-chain-fatty-acid--CoA ligase [Novosphingobium rosa]|uniref:long-chain-fatty-acid--CoA ligase n=1 Tax=Novosphingobium rosa TaxID=76978 RepID=UPI000A0316AC|nr:long-chain fatty acid--CoA ligase [Novosphingobium rosa]